MELACNVCLVPGWVGSGYTYAIKQLADMVIPAQRRNMVNMDSAAQVSQAIRDAKISTKGRALAATLFNNRSAAYLKMNNFNKVGTATSQLE